MLVIFDLRLKVGFIHAYYLNLLHIVPVDMLSIQVDILKGKDQYEKE